MMTRAPVAILNRNDEGHIIGIKYQIARLVWVFDNHGTAVPALNYQPQHFFSMMNNSVSYLSHSALGFYCMLPDLIYTNTARFMHYSLNHFNLQAVGTFTYVYLLSKLFLRAITHILVVQV